MSRNSGGGSGLGLGTILTIIFLILKLVGLSNMSWFWVFFPMGLGVVLWVILFIILMCLYNKQ